MFKKQKSFDQIIGAFTKPIAELQEYVNGMRAAADRYRADETAALAAADTAKVLSAKAEEEADRAETVHNRLETLISLG